MLSPPAPPPDDYYALLGVHAAADGAELRHAWRRVAVQWHPDRAGLGATATFQQLSAAYQVLSDPLKRAAYDRRRRANEPAGASPSRSTTSPWRRAAGSSSSPAGAPRSTRPPVPSIMLTRLCGALSTLIACGAARIEDDGFITLMLRADEAAQGGMVTISMHVDFWCPDCSSQGRSVATARCARCGGRRTVEELFSAWLAIVPGVAAGEILKPSAELPGTTEPVRFRVQPLAR